MQSRQLSSDCIRTCARKAVIGPPPESEVGSFQLTWYSPHLSSLTSFSDGVNGTPGFYKNYANKKSIPS